MRYADDYPKHERVASRWRHTFGPDRGGRPREFGYDRYLAGGRRGRGYDGGYVGGFDERDYPPHPDDLHDPFSGRFRVRGGVSDRGGARPGYFRASGGGGNRNWPNLEG